MNVRILHDVSQDRYFAFLIIDRRPGRYLGCWDKKPTKKELKRAAKQKVEPRQMIMEGMK